MIMRLYLLFLYNQNRLSHHPPVFALFLFYEKKTCTKRKVGRGPEPALSARTNRSRAPTTSSRAVLAPPSTPRSRYVPGGSNSPIPRSVRILNLFVVNICLPRHRNFIIGERLYISPHKKSGAKFFAPLNSYFGKMCPETHFSGKQEENERF